MPYQKLLQQEYPYDLKTGKLLSSVFAAGYNNKGKIVPARIAAFEGAYSIGGSITHENTVTRETIISKEPGNSMLPIIKSKQPVEITPATWENVEIDDIVYCKVKSAFYTHLVKAKDPIKGVLIGNNKGGINGWSKQIYGKITKIL